MSKKFNYLYTILHYYHQEFLKLLYENKKVSNKIDKSWVGLKLSHTIKPGLYPKNITDNSITLYMELQNYGKSWKRN